MDLVSTGAKGLDRLLGGGLLIHQLSMVYGEAASGKTVFSMQCALQAARNNLKIFYVDTDQSFSPNRIERLAGGSDVADQIILFRPEDFKEQVRLVEHLESMLTKTPTLLVIDSITGLYRALDGGSKGFFARDRELNRQLAQLNGLAARFSLWVLLTGQVHSTPSRGEWIIEPVATRALKHWSDLVLRLRVTPRSGVRDCSLEKRNGIEVSGSHCPFKITGEGIEDA